MSVPPSFVSRIARRASDLVLRNRIKSAVTLLGASEFEYWGRYSDAAHADLQPLAATWIERGQTQFDFLKSNGLLPTHRFLDYGCALMATAFHVVPYLQRGNYVGVDVARKAAQRGVRRMSGTGIDRSAYHLLAATSPELHELDGFTFDVIFSFSVLQYLDARDFSIVTARFASLLTGGGICYLTYSEPAEQEALSRKGMRYYGLDAYRAAFPQPDYTIEVARIPFADPAAGRLVAIRRVGTRSAAP